MATYCDKTDLLLGDLATSAAQDPQKFVQDGSNEIEQLLGLRYIVPFQLANLSYVAQLTLKRINVYLASGGFLVSAYGGDNILHQTGLSYLKMAREALKGLVDGEYILEGAAPNPAYANSGTGPRVDNVDKTSKVEDYYASKALGPRPDFIDLSARDLFYRMWFGA